MIRANQDSRPEIAIKVEDLTVSYGPVPALLDISAEIPAGELIGVIGPNGSGKSTLIKSMMGFVKPDVGEVFLFGKEVSQTKGLIAYVPQRGSVDWDFPITVREVAAMGRYGHRRWWQDLSRTDYAAAEEALEQVRMSDFSKRQIGQLSGGQQQRLCIARAIAIGPEILLMDEPCSALDPASTSKIEDLIFELRKQYTIVIVTHNMQQAARCSDRTVFFFEGKIIEDGPTRDLFTNPQNKQTEAYVTGKFG